MAQALPFYAECFVCGEPKMGRLGVRFRVVDGTVRASFTPTEDHMGYPGVVHGGILMALLDEAMVWAVYAATNQFALSSEITVRFLKPLPPGHPVEIIAQFQRRQRRFLEVASEIHDSNAVVYARAWGRFFPVSPEEQEKWVSALTAPGEPQGGEI